MDHHFSWYLFIPGYQEFQNYLIDNFSFTVIFNEGIFPKNPTFNTVHHIFAAFIIILIMIFIYFYLIYKVKKVDNFIIPDSKVNLLNFLEFYLKIISDLMKDVIGSNSKDHLPLIFTLSSFILISNLISMLPGFLPATDNLNTTLACSILVFIYFNFQGFKTSGINHILHLANPIGEKWGWFLCPLMFPVELIGLCIRPFSLAVRLACNMIADHKVLFAFTKIFPFILPLPFFLLGLLVCLIQTVVFCLLTCVYISLHTKHSDH